MVTKKTHITFPENSSKLKLSLAIYNLDIYTSNHD